MKINFYYLTQDSETKFPILDWSIGYGTHYLTRVGKFTGQYYKYIFINFIIFRISFTLDIVYNKKETTPENIKLLRNKK